MSVLGGEQGQQDLGRGHWGLFGEGGGRTGIEVVLSPSCVYVGTTVIAPTPEVEREGLWPQAWPEDNWGGEAYRGLRPPPVPPLLYWWNWEH